MIAAGYDGFEMGKFIFTEKKPHILHKDVLNALLNLKMVRNMVPLKYCKKT